MSNAAPVANARAVWGTCRPWATTAILMALAVFFLAAAAAAQPLLRLAIDADSRGGVIRVGHDVNVAPSIRRFALVVSAVGPADAKGEIYSFQVSLDQNPPTAGRAGQPVRREVLALNEIRSWRITVVSGELLGAEFQVEANDQLDVKVTPDFGPLNGLVKGDFLLVEEVAVRPPPQRVY